jgi:5-carboxymethyl-2-hydroxymuconate isomerase
MPTQGKERPMPHIIVEHSATMKLDLPELLSALHFNLAEQDTVKIKAIKTRAVPVHHVIIGDGRWSDKMLHIALKLLPGRSDELKRTMSQGLFDTAKDFVKDDSISITVEVMELHEASYIK